MSTSFTLLGSSAGPGVPSYFCNCCGCQEARENPALSRTRSGALLCTSSQSCLIDTPPDLKQQLTRIPSVSVDQVFLTHWHYDHFGGLGELEYYVRLHRKKPIPLYLPPSAVASFHSAFPNLSDVFTVQAWEFDHAYDLGECEITPLSATHGVETAGFLIASNENNLAYFPDTAGLPQKTKNELSNLCWFVCDATFTGENWYPDSHMSIDQAVDLGQEIGAENTVLTHLAIHYSHPMTVCDLQEHLADRENVFLAYDGMKFLL